MADTYQVLNLAAIIREVDGSNNKGAAALAESILDHPRFRAVLAGEPAVPQGREPVSVAGQPSDEQLLGTYQAAYGPAWDRGEFYGAHVDGLRAVLARWGTSNLTQTWRSPADGEVAELVAWLRETGDTIQPSHLAEHQRYKRAAELLQRQALVPVSVSERLPGPEDCDAEGRCWWFAPETEVDFGGWTFGTTEICANSQWVDWENTHWLPAHALPLPEAGE